jgi:ribosomal protein S18 acetylase RimI-like enzyme
MATVRRAKIADTPAMGRVHVRAWQAAYRGVMPDDYLDALSSGERERMWSDALNQRDRSRPVLVVEDDEHVVGFAAVGPSSDARTGELYSINVEPESWGNGHGRALLAAAEADLATLGYDEAQLWVLPDNQRARQFYEAAGWAPDGVERTTEVLGVVVQEIRYNRTLSSLKRDSGNAT